MIKRRKSMVTVGRKRALIRLGQRRQIVIPKKICDELGLRRGDLVEVSKSADHVATEPKKVANGPEVTLTPQEEKTVARGFRQLKGGDYVAWDELKSELGL